MIAQKSRTYHYAEVSFDPDSAMKHSGLDYMRALVAGEIGAPPSIGDTIGMSLPTDMEYGKVVFDAVPGDHLLNPMGFVHGGFAATLLDSAMGVAVHTTLDAGMGFTTIELKINYTRAILPTSGRLRAEGNLIHRGRRIATSEGRLVGIEDGKLYAHGTSSCLIFPLKTDAEVK